MSELSVQQVEEFIRANSVECPGDKSEYLKNFSGSLVLYLETDYDIEVNEFIVRNLDEIRSIYCIQGRDFVYLPLLLQDNADLFGYIYPDVPPDQFVMPENITSTITAKLIAEWGVSSDVQGAMLLLYSGYDRDCNTDWMITPIRGNALARQFFQTHADMHEFVDTFFCCSTSCIGEPFDCGFEKHLDEDGNEIVPKIEDVGPEIHFDEDVNEIISEIDRRIDQLKGRGLYRLLSDIIAPMLIPKLSPLCITEDYRIFLPDYNNMEISMNPLSKIVYFLFLRHPEGIYLKKLNMYEDELIQIYRLISNRESLEDMNESVSKLTDPKDNSFYEKCSRIKRSFLQCFSADLAKSYCVSGDFKEPKKISLSRDPVNLPEALKNIRTTLLPE